MDNRETAYVFETMHYPDTDDTYKNWETDTTIVLQRGRDVGNTKMKTRLNFRKHELLITVLKFRDNKTLIVFETMVNFNR